jgi:stabilin-1
MCRPGMTSINNNASEGCHVSCKPHSCDRSATCQVTPDRKTRWAQSRVGGVGSVCLHSGPGGKDLAGGGIKGTVHPSPDRSLWVSSCVCKNDEVGDGHACYGHLLHEVRRANQNGLVFLRLRAAIAMLGVCLCPVPTELGGRPSLSRDSSFFAQELGAAGMEVGTGPMLAI